MEELQPLTEAEAEEIHALAMGTDPLHDRCSCWCCCVDCDELHERVV